MTAIREVTQSLTAKAQAAKCIDEADYGSDRQIEAENAFFEEVEALVGPDSWEGFEGRTLKAATDERIDAAMEMLQELGFIE